MVPKLHERFTNNEAQSDTANKLEELSSDGHSSADFVGKWLTGAVEVMN